MFVTLFILGFIWFCIIYLDIVFTSCMVHPYFRFLRVTGLEISSLTISWKFTHLNRVVTNIAHRNRLFFKLWFDIGVIITCLIIIPCFSLYVTAFINMFKTDSAEKYENAQIMLLIPGLNFPLTHWKLYVCVIIFITSFHEIGHALAGSREEISIQNFGIAVCFFCPIAFVNLPWDQFTGLGKWQKMRVFCAGIWHNVFLSICAMLILSFYTFLLTPLFSVGSGVSVVNIHKDSSLNNPGGFQYGNHIYEVGNCPVEDAETWQKCTIGSKEKYYGICVPSNLHLSKTYPLSLRKCSEELGSLYFEMQNSYNHSMPDGSIIELSTEGICLPARSAVEKYSLCSNELHCRTTELCLFPHLPEFHKFLVIKRRGKPAVLYEGSIDELFVDVEISQYFPKYKVISPRIAETFRLFLEYVLLFSSGLAGLNVLPLFSLDGKFILGVLIDAFFQKWLSYNQRVCVQQFIFCCSLVIIIGFTGMAVQKILFYM